MTSRSGDSATSYCLETTPGRHTGGVTSGPLTCVRIAAKNMKVVLLFLLAVVGPCLAYLTFQGKVPNGDKVPHPCNANATWQGVGHLVPGGGGKRNPFGEDFYMNGKIWDSCLCNYDSDGDGRTNGEELGDPNCVWTVGATPAVTTGITHPGICEPVDSVECQVVNMKLGDFCDSWDVVNPCIANIKAQAGVRSLRIAYPKTPVPAEETTYMCQVFALPDDTDYHIIAAEPNIVNHNVNHHIIVFGCIDNAEVTDPHVECTKAESECTDMLMLWSVGMNGQCLDEAFGFRIGVNGYKKVLMQAHWNNPELVSDYTDSSGMTIYYTPNLRANDGGVLMTGQTYLAIPPGQADYMTSGKCASGCTSVLPQSLHISEAFIHMHYLGLKGYIEHYRNGSKITDLVKQDEYSYDSPVLFRYKDPIEFKAGDEIKTICHFQTTGRTEMTPYGWETNAEMCYGFLTYYPVVSQFIGRFYRTDLRKNLPFSNTTSRIFFTDCVSYNHIPLCETATEEDMVVEGCNYTAWDEINEDFYAGLGVCDVTGATCTPACQALLDDYTTKTECLSGEAYMNTKSLIWAYAGKNAPALINYLESCEDKDNKTPNENDDSHEEKDELLCPSGGLPEPTGKSKTGAATAVLPSCVGLTLLLIATASFHGSMHTNT